MSKPLRMFTGHSVTHDEKEIEGRSIRFKTEDGRCMFEIRCGDDGRSIEVMAVDVCKVGDVLFDTRLTISPRVTNHVIVKTSEYNT